MLYKTSTPAPAPPGWLARRRCDLAGHGTTVALQGPHSQGYTRCERCGRVVGSGE